MWPTSYLAHYYCEVTGENDFLLDAIVACHALREPWGGALLEVGGGPTVYQLVPACGRIESVTFTDLMPENLAAVAAWRDGAPGAHDWSPFFRHVFGPDAAGREAWLKSVLTVHPPADVRDLAAGKVFSPGSFAVLSSFFCLEAVARDPADFHDLIEGLGRLVARNGAMILGTVRNCRAYRIGDSWFDAIPLDEASLPAILGAAGFAVRLLRVLPCSGEDGYDGLMVLLAERDG